MNSREHDEKPQTNTNMSEPSAFSKVERIAVDYFEACGFRVESVGGEWYVMNDNAQFSITAMVYAVLGNRTLTSG